MLIQGDARAIPLIDASVQCCITSPPYWGGLRDYGHAAQLGLEREPADYVRAMVAVFAEVRRVLKPRGTVWLNIGDVYAASGKGGGGHHGHRACWETVRERKGFRMPPPGYKMKDLTLVPFALADSLRRDGWYLRSTIIWRKPTASEPMRLDRPSVSHEYVFLLTKSEKYDTAPCSESWWGQTVWDIRSDGNADHPAKMPDELARRCMVIGTRPTDVVLDPFVGSGTVLAMAHRLDRRAVGVDLAYQHLAAERTSQRGLMFSDRAAV